MLPRRAYAGLVILAASSACATSQQSSTEPKAEVPEISVEGVYRPPLLAEQVTLAAVSEDPPGFIVRRAVSLLENQGFTVAVSDTPFGEMVIATYAGDPSPYLDCGAWLVSSDGSGTTEVPAASADADYLIDVGGQTYPVRTALTLDARMLLDVIGRSPRSTIMAAETQYVVTSVSRASRDGAVVATKGEIIDFKAGQIGEFVTGKRCLANGFLEELVLRP